MLLLIVIIIVIALKIYLCIYIFISFLLILNIGNHQTKNNAFHIVAIICVALNNEIIILLFGYRIRLIWRLIGEIYKYRDCLYRLYKYEKLF